MKSTYGKSQLILELEDILEPYSWFKKDKLYPSLWEIYTHLKQVDRKMEVEF